MSKADQIRAYAADGLSTADIARKVGVRYQHAYNVLKRSEGGGPARISSLQAAKRQTKPPLILSYLLDRGFERIGTWRLGHSGSIEIDCPLPREAGVYVFSIENVVQYVGVATMGLSKRIYFYSRPALTQKTSLRLNALIRDLISQAVCVEVAIARPDNLEWNNLPIHGAAGLELGLIKAFDLPWNKRSSG